MKHAISSLPKEQMLIITEQQFVKDLESLGAKLVIIESDPIERVKQQAKNQWLFKGIKLADTALLALTIFKILREIDWKDVELCVEPVWN